MRKRNRLQSQIEPVVATPFVLSIFLLCGLVGLVYGLVQVAQVAQFVTSARTAEATVVANQRERWPNDNGTLSDTFYPVVTFTTSAGDSITTTYRMGHNPPAYQPGTRLAILYLENNPKEVKVNSFWALWGFSLPFVLVSLVVSVYALLGMSGRLTLYMNPE